MYINIFNMNNKQKQMLTLMWDFRTAGDFVAWRNTLSKEDQLEAMTLLEMMRLEILDQKIDKSQDLTMAQKMLAGLMSK